MGGRRPPVRSRRGWTGADPSAVDDRPRRADPRAPADRRRPGRALSRARRVLAVAPRSARRTSGPGGPAPLRLHRRDDACPRRRRRAGDPRRRVAAGRRLGPPQRRAVRAGGRPIRWIVDDALAFTRREARRGRRYDGIVLDPPTLGHGPAATRWELEDALPDLLDAVRGGRRGRRVRPPHRPHDRPRRRRPRRRARRRVRSRRRLRVAAEPLELMARSGAVLPLGVAARMIRG